MIYYSWLDCSDKEGCEVRIFFKGFLYFLKVDFVKIRESFIDFSPLLNIDIYLIKRGMETLDNLPVILEKNLLWENCKECLGSSLNQKKKYPRT